jgi:hypothetical protein
VGPIIVRPELGVQDPFLVTGHAPKLHLFAGLLEVEHIEACMPESIIERRVHSALISWRPLVRQARKDRFLLSSHAILNVRPLPTARYGQSSSRPRMIFCSSSSREKLSSGCALGSDDMG